MVPMRIRFSEKESKDHGQTSVALPEGGGNLVRLCVFHQLHCVVREEVTHNQVELPIPDWGNVHRDYFANFYILTIT